MTHQGHNLENVHILAPFCMRCGRYKGVGPCKCGNISDKTKVHAYDDSCTICKDKALIYCQLCKAAYCDQHAEDYREMALQGPDHHIGTCILCGAIICENCWIAIDDAIQCVTHLKG